MLEKQRAEEKAKAAHEQARREARNQRLALALRNEFLPPGVSAPEVNMSKGCLAAAAAAAPEPEAAAATAPEQDAPAKRPAATRTGRSSRACASRKHTTLQIATLRWSAAGTGPGFQTP